MGFFFLACVLFLAPASRRPGTGTLPLTLSSGLLGWCALGRRLVDVLGEKAVLEIILPWCLDMVGRCSGTRHPAGAGTNVRPCNGILAKEGVLKSSKGARMGQIGSLYVMI